MARTLNSFREQLRLSGILESDRLRTDGRVPATCFMVFDTPRTFLGHTYSWEGKLLVQGVININSEGLIEGAPTQVCYRFDAYGILRSVKSFADSTPKKEEKKEEKKEKKEEEAPSDFNDPLKRLLVPRHYHKLAGLIREGKIRTFLLQPPLPDRIDRKSWHLELYMPDHSAYIQPLNEETPLNLSDDGTELEWFTKLLDFVDYHDSRKYSSNLHRLVEPSWR